MEKMEMMDVMEDYIIDSMLWQQFDGGDDGDDGDDGNDGDARGGKGLSYIEHQSPSVTNAGNHYILDK
jgi:hypothetical protein